MQLKVLQPTTFKQSTQDAAKLPATDRVTINAGQMFKVHSWKPLANQHLRIALLGQPIGNPPRNTWTVFQPHVQLINSQNQVIPPPTPPKTSGTTLGGTLLLPRSKNLNVPYKSQLDNELNPRGACNVTCFAMVMKYFRLRGDWTVGQLEDELYYYMDRVGLSRHDPGDLAKMARVYGLRDDLTLNGTLYDMRKAIAEGRPCIIHGYFTSFGHIIVVRGYDSRGFWVNDPFGEWMSYGYREDLSGENLHYSNDLIRRTSTPEGNNYLWLHRLSKL
jgi:Peptidase_C39 like family